MTDFTSGKTYHGFTLKRKEYIKEIHSTVYLFAHEVLGTPAFAIKNNDPNKTFCIAFQTVPTDSTGVAHILEHSVLMGSKKYPVKDVFGEINKGGLMTFLNAMTGADTTWYPFATRNNKEYFNIMDVYCDVTLNPLLLRSTFEQEGWHYHRESLDQPLQYQGVVYNEMKGAFSDPFRHLFHNTFKGLMPNSTYAHESGGDPENIPDLSYEEFVDFHEKHYHPSNATLFFYGDADLDTELAYVQENFLSQYESAGEKVQIVTGDPIQGPIFIDESYGVQPGSDLTGKTFLAVGSLTGDVLDRKQNTALQIIANILYNSDASPLKNAIIESGLCSDFGGLFVTGSSFKTFMLTYLIGCDADKRDRFLEIYKHALMSMVTEGLHKDLVLAELNKYEFSVREEMNKAQRGLDLIGKALPAMKYGADPFEALQIEQLFADIRRQAIEEGYFEELIKKLLLDNKGDAVVTLKPDAEKIEQNILSENNRLLAYQQQMGAEKMAELVQHTQDLSEKQAQPNDEQTLALLPALGIDDLNHDLQFFQTTPEAINQRPLLINELDTSSISYMDFGFNCSGLSAEALVYLDLFGTIITEIGTDDMDYRHFAKQINICTGGFSHAFSTYQQKNKAESLQPILWFQVKALSSFLDDALELIGQVIREFSLSDRVRIREIVQREFSWAEHSIQSEGYSLAAMRVFSHLSPAGKYNEQITGTTSYLALKNLAAHYDELEEQFLHILAELRDHLLVQSRFLCSITSRPEDIARFKELLPDFLEPFPKGTMEESSTQFPEHPKKQAFCTSAEVVYNVKGANLFPDPNLYSGQFEVLKTWLSRDYLWNTVRQVGGAYGCFIQFNQLTGNMGIISYRDPQVEKTFAAYDNAWTQVESLQLPQPVLQQLVIGTYGNFDPHQGPAAQGATARNEYLSGITPADKQQRVDEILTTEVADLQAFAPYLKNIAESTFIATIGNSAKIKENAALYDDIIEL